MLVLLSGSSRRGGVELLDPGVLQYLVEGHSVFRILLEKTVNEVSGTWAR